MSLDAFKELLEEVKQEIRKIPASVQLPQHPDIEFPTDILKKIESELEKVPELDEMGNCHLRLVSSSASIGSFRLSIAVLEHLSLGAEPNEIVSYLVDLVTKKRASTYYLAGVAGVKLDQPLQLAKNVMLVTEKSLSPSSAKEAVFRISRLGTIAGSSGHEIPRPLVALKIDSEEQVLVPKKSSYSPKLTMDAIRDIEQKCLACLTLASDAAAPTYTCKTSWLDHPAQPYHGLAGGSYGTSPAQQYPLSPASFVGKLAVEIFAGIDALDDGTKAPLLVAVDRLRKSRLHEQPVDRAIDLGIALEILLLHDVEHQHELSHRASMHGARFLETDLVKRKEVFRELRAAYDARSSAVHEGKINLKKVASLAPADQLVRRVAVKMIESRSFPKWDDVVFGP